MKKLSFISIALSLMLILTACQDDSTSPSKSKEIMPLALGNFWVYQQLYYDSNGNLTDSEIDTLLVKRQFTYNGKVYFSFDEYDEEHQDEGLRNADGGLYQLNYDYDNETFSEDLMFKYPAKTGDVFMINEEEVKVISTNATISVPKGSFSCYHYKIESEYIDEDDPSYSRKIIENLYMAPGVGMVKYEIIRNYFNGDLYRKYYLNLMDYKLN